MTTVASSAPSRPTAKLAAEPAPDYAGDPQHALTSDPQKGPTMNVATAARIAAWNFIAITDLPAGAKVAVEDGWVTVNSPGGQPVRAPYGPADTPETLDRALKSAAQAAQQDPH